MFTPCSKEDFKMRILVIGLFLICGIVPLALGSACNTFGEYITAYGECQSMVFEGYDGIQSESDLGNALDKTCNDNMPKAKECMLAKMTGCSDTFMTKLDGWFNAYHGRMCNENGAKDEVKSHMTGLITMMASGPPQCMASLGNNNADELNHCLKPIMMGSGSGGNASHALQMFVMKLYVGSVEKGLNTMKKFYRSAFHCFGSVVKEKCPSGEAEMLLQYYAMMYLPLGIDLQEDGLFSDGSRPRPKPRLGPRSMVSVWGDPHILVYKGGVETISEVGTVTYLDNDYVTVKAVNSPVKAGSTATFLTSISIKLYDGTEPRTLLATYECSANDVTPLPPSFVGGQAIVGKGTENEVEARMVKNKFLRITHKAAGAVIVITFLKKMYPVLTIRMSDSLLDKSYGVLVTGSMDTVDTSNRRKRSTSCKSTCANGDPLTRLQCEFDCLKASQDASKHMDEIDLDDDRRKRSTTCTDACANVDPKDKPYCEFDCGETGDTELAVAASNDRQEAEVDATEVDNVLSDGSGANDKIMNKECYLVGLCLAIVAALLAT